MKFAKIRNCFEFIMTDKEIKISYREYETMAELDSREQTVAEAAIEAMRQSYAPYSHFNVGAAVMMEDGEVITGANQENAAYPSGLCAERTALFYAGASRPEKAVALLAIAGGQKGVLCDNPATPCGACRQVMAQYQLRGSRHMEILLVGAKKIWKFYKVEDLLPMIFDSV